MPQTLKCLECGNEAQQPSTPVLSVHGNTFVLPEVWCCNGHRPSLMERVKAESDEDRLRNEVGRFEQDLRDLA